MKTFKLICILFSISFNIEAYVVNEKISTKYNKIFSNNFLTNSDIYFYKKIFIFQENCKWKKANREILKIENKILIGHVLAQSIFILVAINLNLLS